MYLRTASVGYERGLEEPALRCYADRLGARIDAQLVEDRSEMLGDGALGEEELVADGLAGEARGAVPAALVRSGAAGAARTQRIRQRAYSLTLRLG
ncbi:MAG TPA: hypothetical protein VGS80_01065 [Ktedonobacterales bacterium]|nr:hypothetical protein [Ktedonobacterales bacterium]